MLAQPAEFVDGQLKIPCPSQEERKEGRFLIGAKDEGMWESRHEPG
jgi:hypothetical protein